MAHGLLKKILKHTKEQGWVQDNSICVDPFFGIGSTGILGAYENIQVIGIELEAKFVKLAEQNFKIHDDAWIEFGHPRPVIIQGDSRKLCSVVESADIIVSSPPFQESSLHGVDTNPERMMGGACSPTSHGGGKVKYVNPQTPGQLGSMKPGKVDMVISSPPYAETFNESKHTLSGMAKRDKRIAANFVGGYGSTPGNLGNLKAGDVDVILSSPPYEGSAVIASGVQRNEVNWQAGKDLTGGKSKHYGETEGQLGENKGDTFWQAAKEILEQCHKILKPGGHAIWVCKDFVRKGQRVPFSDDWQRLCESVGFKTIHRHKAMLVKETKYESLFGHDIVKKTERKSFFRRLAEAKGSPKIDWEDVICMVRS